MAAVDFVLLFLSWAHVLISPYTKVEESFNLHATHDVFFYGVAKASLKKYDHFVFPGVVPRTFVGSVLLAWTTKVLSAPLIWLGLLNSKFDIQIMLRLILASANTFAFSRVRRAISHRFGYATGTMFGLITCTQFHLPFWMGRTLPNMFALVPCNIAFARLISNQADVTVPVSLLVLAAVVFRAELAVYVGILSLYLLLRTRTSLTKLVAVGLISGFTSLAITVSVDSYFWQKWPLWPEWQGIYFNVVEGKSSEWGVSPVYAYWALHLPKLLLGTFPFSLVGFTVDPRIRAVAIPPIIFVCILSLLGHKEWRFVVYVVPVFNLAAANAFVWCSQRLPWTRVVRFALLTTLVANAAVAGLLTMISNANYPGGDALTQANKMSRANVTMHICNLAAQTGASLFLQEHSPPYLLDSMHFIGSQWTYDKTEGDVDLRWYTHAIVEDLPPSKWSTNATVDAFDGLSKKGIRYSPKLWVITNPDAPGV